MDDRKFARSKEDLEQIARRYNVDVDVLEHLVRYVNTPSIGEGTVVRKVNVQDGQESITMKVCLLSFLSFPFGCRAYGDVVGCVDRT